MAYKKIEKPPGLSLAKIRHQAMENIESKEGGAVEYGSTSNPLSAATFGAEIAAIDAAIAEHNKLLQSADTSKNNIDAKIKELQSKFSRVLKGAVGKFGENHNYVEQLGGTRKEERKRPVRKAKGSGN
jgi:hypothetical protein